MVAAAANLAQSIVQVPVDKVDGHRLRHGNDVLSVEEPLEIRLLYYDGDRPAQKSLSITMRTPGHDLELAAGFLFGEGIIPSRASIAGLRPGGPPAGQLQLHNIVYVELAPDVDVDLQRLERHFYTSSSCGICGKASLAAIEVAGASPVVAGQPIIAADVLYGLPDALRRAQDVFEQTGGLHAAALFEADGTLTVVREDVGRHNAVDKLIGSQLLPDRLPLSRSVLLVSGRASFELVQKAVVAGIPLMAAVGAPSSLAVATAAHFGMTLVGFVRNNRFNIYCGAARIAGVAT